MRENLWYTPAKRELKLRNSLSHAQESRSTCQVCPGEKSNKHSQLISDRVFPSRLVRLAERIRCGTDTGG